MRLSKLRINVNSNLSYNIEVIKSKFDFSL
jgi:hypothetical protein